jgi:hypothetical protein
MFDLQIDLSAFERKARQLGAAIDQVPVALANTLNEAAFATRGSLISETGRARSWCAIRTSSSPPCGSSPPRSGS